MNVFFVTVMYLGDKLTEGEKKTGLRAERCWGFFTKFEDAEQAVLENHTDMFECGYYDTAVIEEMPEGLCPIAESEKWYHATYHREQDTHEVTAIEKPEQFSHVCNFGIG